MNTHQGSEWSSRKQNIKKSMDVLEEVQSNYKNKLRQLNYFGTKKKVIQLKFEIFQDWIKYLQEENKLLAQLVIDLEDDVIRDIQSLKQNTPEPTEISQTPDTSLKDYQSEDMQKYKSDLRNLLLFLKAIRENVADNFNLSFYYVRNEDLYGSSPVKYTVQSDEALINNLKQERDNLESKNEELQKELARRERLLEEQDNKIYELEQKLLDQEKYHKEDMLRRREVGGSFEKLLSAKQSNVWETSKEVTNNMIQIWDKLVDKKVSEDRSSSNFHVVMDKSDNALDSLQQAVNLITKELQSQGTISKQSQGDALLFIVFDKNKNQ